MLNHPILKINTIVYLFLFLASCTTDFKPKPKGYNHIDLPEHRYQLFTEADKPYVFEYNVNAFPEDDTASYKEKKKLYKILKYPELNFNIHLTYKDINGSTDSLDSFINESFRLAYGHDVKAYGITPEMVTLPGKMTATIITLEGDVPSQYQFFVHDSTMHFLRGAVYFPIANKNDSLAPVIEYVKEDIQHLLKTLKWKE